ncbi:Hypothetical predicted protein, partial [Mytilus galloprovincialis]
MVTYAMNLTKKITRLADFLEIPNKEILVAGVVDKCSFNKLKENKVMPFMVKAKLSSLFRKVISILPYLTLTPHMNLTLTYLTLPLPLPYLTEICDARDSCEPAEGRLRARGIGATYGSITAFWHQVITSKGYRVKEKLNCCTETKNFVQDAYGY